MLVVLEHYGLAPESITQDLSVLLLCPFHDDTRASLSVSLEKDLYYCFGCGATGGPVDFIARMENINELKAHMQLIRIRKRGHGMIRSFEKLRRMKPRPVPPPEIYPIPLWELIWANGDSNDPRYYPFMRGLHPETLYVWCVGWDSLSRSLVFHIAFHGKYVGWQKRRVNGEIPPYICSPGFRKTGLYWSAEYTDVETHLPLLLVEGPMDALFAYQYGYTNVAALLGSPSRHQEAWIVKYPGDILCALDNDDTGRHYFAHISSLRKVLSVDYSSWGGAKDVAELDYVSFWESIPKEVSHG